MLLPYAVICRIFAITLIWIMQNYLQLVLCVVVSIIAIVFCMVSRTLTSPNFTVFRIKLAHVLTKSLAVFLCFVPFEYCSRSVFDLQSASWKAPCLSSLNVCCITAIHCFVPFIGSLKNLEYRPRSAFWPTKRFMKSTLFILTQCLLHHSHLVHWDETKELVCRSLGSRRTQVQELFTLVLRLSGTTSTVCPFSLCYLQEASEDTSLWLGLSPSDTGTPDSP